MARLYVGGKFEEAQFIKTVMQNLRSVGHEITHDWTDESVAGLRGIEVLDVLQDAAIQDADGVRYADAMVLVHHDNLRGGLTELGVALGCNIPIIVIGGRGQTYPPIFYWHPDVIHVGSVAEAIQQLEILFPGEQQGESCVEFVLGAIEEALPCGLCSSPESCHACYVAGVDQ